MVAAAWQAQLVSLLPQQRIAVQQRRLGAAAAAAAE
jgi:hypothetical protein